MLPDSNVRFLPLDDDYLQEWAAEPERAVAEETASELLEQGHGHAGPRHMNLLSAKKISFRSQSGAFVSVTGANSDAEEMDARTAAMALLLALSSAFPEVVVPILGDFPTKVAAAVPCCRCQFCKFCLTTSTACSGPISRFQEMGCRR